MPEYLNHHPDDPTRPVAGEGYECRFSVENRLCGLTRYIGFERCIFHLPDEAPRPGNASLKAELEKAARNGAELRLANLQGVDLGGAQLHGAKLREARLQRAHLDCAELQGATLLRAELQGAALRTAKLQGASLEFASLQGTILEGADLTGACLKGVIITPETNLDDVNWGPDSIILLEKMADTKRKTHPDEAAALYRAAERVYQQAMISYQRWGIQRMAGEFFLRMMECRRKGHPRIGICEWLRRGSLSATIPLVATLADLLRPKHYRRMMHALRLRCREAGRLLSALGWGALLWLCGYGERPWRSAGWLVAAAVGVLACPQALRTIGGWVVAFLISLFVVTFARTFQR